MSRNWDMDKQNVTHPSPAVVHSRKTRTAGGMGLKDLMLSERSQAEKNHLLGDYIYVKCPENSKLVDTDCKSVAVWAGGVRTRVDSKEAWGVSRGDGNVCKWSVVTGVPLET